MMQLFLLNAVCPAGRQALFCFLLAVLLFSLSFFSGTFLGFTSELWALTYWGPALYFCLFNFILKYCYQGFMYEISIRSAFLGAAFSMGLFLSTFNNGWKVFGLYMMILSFFHFSEFVAVAITNPENLSVGSFMLNHSIQYNLAAVTSWAEWAFEYYFFPDTKELFWLSYVGVLICIAGEIIRKLAMVTAATNFTQKVQYRKRPGHELITHGVYSLWRHPGYVGWFYWSIGTQIVQLNPICVILYALASWTFFRARIFAEECILLSFFGQQYINYQKKVGTGLPFILGYVSENTRQTIHREHWSY